MTLYRPKPISTRTAQTIDRSADPKAAAQRLQAGETLLVTDHYSTGAEILAQLQSSLRPPPDTAPYESRQAHRQAFREASLRLLAPISDHQLKLQGARAISLLKELYPKSNDFLLPFPQVQELHGASHHYREGLHFAVLGHKLHPFYGTYAPNRTSHLELFGTWLSQYDGPRTHGTDVGTGCGVLAYMLCRAGFTKVLATDNNPNAIESVSRDLQRTPAPIEPLLGDLLEPCDTTDLIVFNPPWILGEQMNPLDGALYFEDGLFARFFDQACTRISSTGRVVIVFSNVLSLVQPEVPHPIETELERGRFKLVQKLQRKVKPPPSKHGKRRRTKEKVEIWELALADN